MGKVAGMTNRLYYGDNLEWLTNHAHFPEGCVDLVYLDPPFNSNATYSQLFKSPDGKTADSQIEAFEDTWAWGLSAEAAYDRVLAKGNTDVAQLLQALRGFLHDNAMMAYLAMMAARLVELHRVLKPTGSLYLHCDPTASHYLKLLRDAFPGIAFVTEGQPKDLASAMLLAERDKHEFQKWVVTWIGGRPWKGGQKGTDGGIDGLIFFSGFDATTQKPTQENAIISVKGGTSRGVGFVADLVESIGRNKAALGILVMAAAPTPEMEKRAAAAGFFETGAMGQKVPRIQIFTLAELWMGRRPVIPNVSTGMFKAAPEEVVQGGLEF